MPLKLYSKGIVWNFDLIVQLLCGTDPFPTDFRAKKYKLHKHFISKEDFQQIMRSLPLPVSEMDIEEMFSFADRNKDGKLSYKEFEVKIIFHLYFFSLLVNWLYIVGNIRLLF